eukprot:scaffold26275_cov31-Tisochrysis_lutea.AAC.2
MERLGAALGSSTLLLRLACLSRPPPRLSSPHGGGAPPLSPRAVRCPEHAADGQGQPERASSLESHAPRPAARTARAPERRAAERCCDVCICSARAWRHRKPAG